MRKGIEAHPHPIIMHTKPCESRLRVGQLKISESWNKSEFAHCGAIYAIRQLIKAEAGWSRTAWRLESFNSPEMIYLGSVTGKQQASSVLSYKLPYL